MALGFVIGITVGGMLGLLLAPTVHAWLGRLEWKAATREIELTDRLLESLASAPDHQPGPHEGISNKRLPLHEHAH